MSPRVVVTAQSAHPVDLDHLFTKVVDFAAYPQQCHDVVDVQVHKSGETVTSGWTVAFRGGLLKWSESDDTDHAHRVTTFDQISGDFAVFKGGWKVYEIDAGPATVEFDAVFDIGIASLADLLNPVAGRALVENVTSMMVGIVGSDADIRSRIENDANTAVTTPV